MDLMAMLLKFGHNRQFDIKTMQYLKVGNNNNYKSILYEKRIRKVSSF